MTYAELMGGVIGDDVDLGVPEADDWYVRAVPAMLDEDLHDPGTVLALADCPLCNNTGVVPGDIDSHDCCWGQMRQEREEVRELGGGL